MTGDNTHEEGLIGQMDELCAFSGRLRQAEAEKEDAQRALRESESKYRELVENLNEVVYSVDNAGVITYLSPSIEAVLGYGPGEIVGRRFEDFVVPEDRGRILLQYRRILVEGPSGPNEYRLMTKSGDVRWILVSSRQLFSGGEVAGLQGIMTDVTQRRIAEEKVRESERWYRTIIEDLPVLMCCFDPDGTITFVNEAYCEYFGRTHEELVGTRFMELIPEGDREFVKRKFSELTLENPVGTYEHKVIGSKGDILRQRWTDRAIFDENGKLLSYKSIGQDITDQHNLEERLRQSEKLEAIGQLASGIAHDFNNQLTAILGSAEMIRLRLGDDEVLLRSINMIIRASLRSSDMANKLLAFARKGRRRSVAVDIHQLIGEVVEILNASITKRIEIRTDLSADAFTVTGDPTQLQSVLLNIALNARDAMPRGGLLTLATATVDFPGPAGTAFAPALSDGRYLALSISDTGVGMDAATQSRVFEPFFTTKPEGAGTGMGLAAAYGALKAHCGDIEVESEPGRGTTFRFYLPASDAAARSGEQGPAAPLSRLSGRIMMVDDDDAVRDATCAMLEAIGHSVIAFATGEEAIFHFRENHHQVDLVLLDMLMPGISGGEAFTELRRINPGAKIVVCSGYTAEDERRRFAGAAGILIKPFEMAVLARTIEKALEPTACSGSI